MKKGGLSWNWMVKNMNYIYKFKAGKIFFALTLFCQTFCWAQDARPKEAPVKTAISNIPGKISLDIKGMDIADVLKIFSTRSGMNLAVGKNVIGRVTLFLKDVDVQDAFDIAVLSNDLAYDKKGGIVNVMTQRDYELIYGERFQDKKQIKYAPLKYAKAVNLSKTLNQIKTNAGRVIVDENSNILMLVDTPGKISAMEEFIKSADLPMKTRVFGLNYATVDKITAKIQDEITKGAGLITIDERTNKIAVTDYPEKLDNIALLISAFDEKTPQVLIDAQIIELKPTDKFEMGVDWDFWIKNNFKVTNALPVGTASRLILGTRNAAAASRGEYKTILDILRTVGDAKVLSSPRIMVLNNQEAKILVGTKDAYITSSASQSGSGSTITSQSVNFVDTGIKLYVTPIINRDNFVVMKIRPEISSAEKTAITSEDKKTEIPIITTSEAETTVMVKDGVTIVIGGLRKDTKKKDVKKIPILGDIPFLGMFFRSTSDETSKIELIILLTPHIVSGENTFTNFSEIRPKEGAVMKMLEGEIVMEKFSAFKAKKEPVSSEKIAEYYESVTGKVRSLAGRIHPQGEAGIVNVRFTLSDGGWLLGEPDILYTSNSALNQFALTAIRESAPFASFPSYLKKEKEAFEIALAYE